ncbi:MAG: DHH family phosphoesterase [Bacteroidales bacterium]|nr:DHH family phosphoesterase [Bacteroidales bacterium]
MITKIIAEDLVQRAKHLLHHSDVVAIVSHQGPDGDALGSSLAMADFLTQQGKTVQVMYPDMFPGFLSWMPGADKALIYAQDPEACKSFLKEADMIVCLDFNQLKRIGELGEIIGNLKAKKLMFDHHPTPDQFADVQISYPQFASTSEIVFRYICRSGCFDEMTLACAECVYTGMMTDTGAFTYNSNQEEMYFIIYQLIRKGIDKDGIYNKVFNNYSADRMSLMGFVLNHRMTVLPGSHTAIMHLTLEDLKKYHYKPGDTEGFVNLPLSIDGIVFSVFFREDTDKIKISFRSRGTFPTNKVASELFNGGGHLNASGGEFYGRMEDAIRLLQDGLPKYDI